jgi:hypothetical protein
MLRRTIFILAFTACAALPAWAADSDVMAGYYGNTVVETGGMADTHWIYGADHTFDMKVPSFGVEFKGNWAVTGANLCRTFDSPPPGVTNPLCSPAEAHKVGDTWTSTNGGETRTLALVQGIQ